jgi:type I restriction enzyme, R subunit
LALSEADTRAKLIDPALHQCGWTEDLIKREETAGSIVIVDNKARKSGKGRTDYTLRVKVNIDTQPVAVAVLEAKAEHRSATDGLEQAKLYASCERLNVPFVISTNGHLFVMYDRYSGQTTTPRPLSELPSPDHLRQRYEAAMGFLLTSDLAKPLLTRYTGGEATRRYYQDAAIRAVLEKLARGEKRALLSLATGAGKTFIAVQLLKRIADAGQLRRALFVCDRDELRAQGLGALQSVFASDAAEVYRKSDGTNNAKNARIHVATYQTLDVANEDSSANFLTTFYPEDYFSHIVIDECHRSAWGSWSKVLTRNPNAVQIGLTATPRTLAIDEKTKEAQADLQVTSDNVKHFGEAVYEYDMAQGIEDGYLAACQIQRGRVNLDDTGITLDAIMQRGPTDAITGRPLSREELEDLYQKTDFESRIWLPDRVIAMCRDLFDYLVKTGGPEQKTIVFCVRDTHADAVAIELNNLYASWCAQQGRERLEPYAFKCTASVGGAQYVADLKGASRSYFIATTVDLLSTGVDVPRLQNIAFFKYVTSPISFYQMVGRGTRLNPATGKLMFRVYDYTDATRLFGQDFVTPAPPGPPTGPKDPGGPEPPTGDPPPPPPIVSVQGFDVQVSDAGTLILTSIDGKATPVTVEEYKERLTVKLVEEAPTLEAFRAKWVTPPLRRELLGQLPDAGRSALLIRDLESMQDFDLYDVLADLGYGMQPRTRTERATSFDYKHSAWLQAMPPQTASAIHALASQFSKGGTDGLENPRIFDTPEMRGAGGLAALRLFGEPRDVLNETKTRMFAA